MRRCTMQAIAITLAVLAGAPPALGQDDGVFVDPDSPTAKEYAIPLESARRQASGGDTSELGPSGTATPAPRFGEGVGDDDGPAGASGNGSGGKGSGGSGSGSGGPRGSAAENGSTSGTPAATSIPSRPGAPDGGGIGTTLTVIGGAAALLLAGGGAGYALRRRDSSLSPS